jgi:hypothetical protein
VKLQYLGDSKDSFKWDYDDYLTSELRRRRLNVALMLTPDDEGNHGKTKAEWFPARKPILNFCRDLRSDRSTERIKALPRISRTVLTTFPDLIRTSNSSCFLTQTMASSRRGRAKTST